MNDHKWMNMVLNDEMYKVLNGPTLNNSFIYRSIIHPFYLNLSVRYIVSLLQSSKCIRLKDRLEIGVMFSLLFFPRAPLMLIRTHLSKQKRSLVLIKFTTSG